ncbi:MAG: M48 family metallopeptidase [Chloroherpetonaceae bacterium]|nr:M48 family metallopeptidase [Chthonomonadaceae bacterium]MDW8206870.1 M48 family metallopeptidase [Chloroherpetonaceae bacterium]
MTATPDLTLPPRVRFPGLSSAAFEHPEDRAALEALRRTPGLDRLFKWLSDMGAERFVRIMFTGDSIRVSSRQCSRLYNDLREACAILDVPEPEFYLTQHYQPNAFAFGMQRHTLVMSTTLVDLLDDTERLSVIGHELGHIKAEHMLYRTMAIALTTVLQSVAGGLTIPGAILTQALVYSLFYWFRRSEMTADRAGLLVAQDPDVCISALLKLVGGSRRLMDDLNIDEFVRQADAYEDMDEDLLSLYYKFLMVREQTHPFPAIRARLIREWAQSEEYARLLRGDYPRVHTDAGKRTCGQCGVSIVNVSFRFCPECGAPLDAPPAA